MYLLNIWLDSKEATSNCARPELKRKAKYKVIPFATTFVASLLCQSIGPTYVSSPAFAEDSHMSGAVSTSVGYRKSGEESLRLGNYKDAQNAFLQAVKELKGSSVPVADESVLHADLGESYLWLGDFAKANSELNRAMSQAEKAKDNLLIGRITDLQSWLAQGFGKQDKSIQLCEQGVALRQKYAPDSADLADSLEHMGILYSSNGLMDQGQKSFEQALTIRKKLTGDNSMDVANLLEQIGAICSKRGRTEEAMQMIKQALSLKEATGAALQPFTPHVADDSVVFHFIKGAPNCSREFSNGNLVQRITGNGIVAQATITLKPNEFVKSTRASISIQNNSNQPINFLSQPASFIVVRPKVILANQLSADQMAADIEKKGKHKAGWVRFWGANATTSVTTTVIGNNGFMPYGYVPTNFGYTPSTYYNRSGGMTTMTTSVPDYQARARAEAKAADIASRSKADADKVIENSLGPSTIAAGGSISGFLDFEPVVFSESILRVPIGNAIFEFHFVPIKD